MSRYPWRLGATSWVVPADLLTNVRLLADRVEDIQLLFFESAAKSGLAHNPDIGALAAIAADHDLTYTVHLPTDLHLGAEDCSHRESGIGEILRLVEELEPLGVRAFDLHLDPEPDLAPTAWLGYVERSLAALTEKMGNDSKLIAIENIGPSPEAIWSLGRRYGFGICLDVGHLLRDGVEWRRVLDDHSGLLRHVHYHGVRNGRDHRAIDATQEKVTHVLGTTLDRSGYQGVVTIEVYAEKRLTASLAALEKTWHEFER